MDEVVMPYVLHQGSCLDILPHIPSGSVDAVICDPPYGTTARNEWDRIIPLQQMWAELNRVTKREGAIVLFSAQPFTSELVMSNRRQFRQEIIWDKVAPVGFLDANRRHMRRHENVLLFSAVGYPTFNPQMSHGTPYVSHKRTAAKDTTKVYNGYTPTVTVNEGTRYPTSIIQFNNGNRKKDGHPTQKPVELMRYLVRTYSNEGEVVLDFTMGVGSTGVAAVLERRNFLGIEIDTGYFATAERRLRQAYWERTGLLEVADDTANLGAC